MRRSFMILGVLAFVSACDGGKAKSPDAGSTGDTGSTSEPPQGLTATASGDEGATSQPAENATETVAAAEPVKGVTRSFQSMVASTEYLRASLEAEARATALAPAELPACVAYQADLTGQIETVTLTACPVAMATLSGSGTLDSTAYPVVEADITLAIASPSGQIGVTLAMHWDDVTQAAPPTIDASSFSVTLSGAISNTERTVTVASFTLEVVTAPAAAVKISIPDKGLHIVNLETRATLDAGFSATFEGEKVAGTFSGTYVSGANTFDVQNGTVAASPASVDLSLTAHAVKGGSAMSLDAFTLTFATGGSFSGAIQATFVVPAVTVTTLGGFGFTGDDTQLVLDGPVVMETLGQELTGQAVAVAKRHGESYPYAGELVLGYQTPPVLGWYYAITETTQYAANTPTDGWALVDRYEKLVKPDGSMHSEKHAYTCRNLDKESAEPSYAATAGATCGP